MADQATQRQDARGDFQKRKSVKDMNPVEKKAFFAEKQQIKEDRAKEPDTAVINKKALETSTTITLVETNDYYMTLLRSQSIGRASRIDTKTTIELVARLEAIQDDLNLLNMDLAKVLRKNYRVPYVLERFQKMDGKEKPAAKPVEKVKGSKARQEVVAQAEAA